MTKSLVDQRRRISVFGPIDHVGCAPACSGVTCSRSAATSPVLLRPCQPPAWRPRRSAAAQALGQRGSVRVDRHDLDHRRRRRQHQRTTGDRRFCWPAPAGTHPSAANASQAQRADQRIEDDVGPVCSTSRVAASGSVGMSPTCCAACFVSDGNIGHLNLRTLSQQRSDTPPAASPTTSKRSDCRR